jgi:D-alanyl-D-alanine dipeptidase
MRALRLLLIAAACLVAGLLAPVASATTVVPPVVPQTTTPLTDTDGDGVADASDNCPLVANADQNPAACPQGPTITVPPPMTVQATDASGAVVTYTVTATDAVDGAITPYCAPLSGSVFPIGLTNVTCTAQDLSGNEATPVTFPVTVSPLTPTVPTTGAPLAADDAVATVAGNPVEIAYLANDLDPTGDATTEITMNPSQGRVETRMGVLRYAPQMGFTGADRLQYQLCIPPVAPATQPVCDAATVAIQVHPATGLAQTALTVPTWQAVSQRTTAGVTQNCSGALAWGGHANGMIPMEQMASVGAPHVLERAAAQAFTEMRAAAAAQGVQIPITDSYRSYAAQVAVRAAKGAYVATATPGTSVHGWGKALDINLTGGGPALRPWLEQNSVRFGWVNPAWAKRPGKSFEPWHYEFYGAQPGATGVPGAPGVTGGSSGGCGQVTTAAAAPPGILPPEVAGPEQAPAAVPGVPPGQAPVTVNPVAAMLRNPGVRIGMGAAGLGGAAYAILRLARDVQRSRFEDREGGGDGSG